MPGPQEQHEPAGASSSGASASVLDTIVIGASGVLGNAIARRLATERRVLATYFSRPEAMRDLHAAGCSTASVDVRDAVAVEALLQRVRPSALVLCAGTPGAGLAAAMSASAWRAALDVHLEGLFHCVRAALKYLPDGARVVWLGSRVAQVGGVGQSAYAACKAAGEALMKSAAREGGERRIAFNTVCPGFVASEMTSGLSPQRLQRERERDAWGQLGEARACAETVAWLLSAQAHGISGQVFHADARLW